MKLQEITVKDVIQATPEETIGLVAKRMRDSAVGCLVVTVSGVVKGIIDRGATRDTRAPAEKNCWCRCGCLTRSIVRNVTRVRCDGVLECAG